MLVERTNDAIRINEIANHPAIRPWIAPGYDAVDLSDKVAEPANVMLVGDHGAFVVFNYGGGIYEAHTMVLPEGRGEWCRMFCVAGTTYMFCVTDCAEILTRVPHGHTSADRLTRAMGFELQFTTPAETEFRGSVVPVAVWSLSIQKWALLCKHFEQQGASFHDWMSTRLSGMPHANDPDHNRIVGITLEMMRDGQYQKGIVWYNRWALAARHPVISLLNENPVQVKFDAGILTLQDGRIEVEQLH